MRLTIATLFQQAPTAHCKFGWLNRASCRNERGEVGGWEAGSACCATRQVQRVFQSYHSKIIVQRPSVIRGVVLNTLDLVQLCIVLAMSFVDKVIDSVFAYSNPDVGNPSAVSCCEDVIRRDDGPSAERLILGPCGNNSGLPWDRMLIGLLSPYDPVRGIRSTSEAYNFLLGRWRRRTTRLDQ